MQKIFLNICFFVLIASCTPQQNIKAGDTSTLNYTFKGSYDEIWDATLNHISSHYTIESIDMDTRTIHARFKTITPNHLLDCGKLQDTGTLQDGSSFRYIYNGADSPVYTITKINGNYVYNTRTLELEGSIQISLHEKSKTKTMMAIKIYYTLSKQNTYRSTSNKQINLQNAYNGENKKEIMSFYYNEIGTFAMDAPPEENPPKGTMQCVAKTVIEDSISQNITQILEKNI